MNIKTYKFSYGGILKKIISKTVSLFYNTMVSGIVLLVYFFIVSEMNFRLKNLIDDSIISIFQTIEVYLGIVICSIFIVPSFFQQKVEISENIVKVYRHCLFLSVFMIFRGFNDTILISQIKEIYRPKNKDKFFEPIPVNIIDWDNMVIIKMNDSLGTIYYIPVENSDDFIVEVNKRINNLNSSSQF